MPLSLPCDEAPLLLIAGPCQIESLDHALFCAEKLKKIAAHVGMGFVYKSSYDKANRTSGKTKRGPGLEAGLAVLAKVRAKVGVPVLGRGSGRCHRPWTHSRSIWPSRPWVGSAKALAPAASLWHPLGRTQHPPSPYDCPPAGGFGSGEILPQLSSRVSDHPAVFLADIFKASKIVIFAS